MSRTFDYVITFVVGLTAGALCAKMYYEDKYKALAEEEIASVKAVFHTKDNEPESSVTIIRDDGKSDVEKYEDLVASTVYGKPGTEAETTDYHTFYKNAEVDKEKIEVNMAEREFPREEPRPRIISQTDYDETELSFDKMSCTFYVPDKIVVDDLSREVVEPDVIGEENIEYLLTTDEKIICIRNESIAVDMEISKDESSVAETGDLVWRG